MGKEQATIDQPKRFFLGVAIAKTREAYANALAVSASDGMPSAQIPRRRFFALAAVTAATVVMPSQLQAAERYRRFLVGSDVQVLREGQEYQFGSVSGVIMRDHRNGFVDVYIREIIGLDGESLDETKINGTQVQKGRTAILSTSILDLTNRLAANPDNYREVTGADREVTDAELEANFDDLIKKGKDPQALEFLEQDLSEQQRNALYLAIGKYCNEKVVERALQHPQVTAYQRVRLLQGARSAGNKKTEALIQNHIDNN